MSNHLSLLVLLVATIPAAQSIPCEEPPKTIDGFTQRDHLGWSTKHMELPHSLPREPLKRDITIGASTCGWITGDPDRKQAPIPFYFDLGFIILYKLKCSNTVEPYVVEATTASPTCFYNSDLAIINRWVTCIDYPVTTSSTCSSFCEEPTNYWFALPCSKIKSNFRLKTFLC
jgi:hypothetical protein